MDDIRDQLMRRAYLYVDAEAYRAGVDAALSAVADAHTQAAADAAVDEHDEAVTVLALNR